MMNQYRPETLARIHRWRNRMLCKRYCHQLSRNQGFSTSYQIPQLCEEWVWNCLLFFFSWLTLFLKKYLCQHFRGWYFCYKYPSVRELIFQTRSLFLLHFLFLRFPQFFCVIVLFNIEKLLDFNISYTEAAFFVENTPQANFVFVFIAFWIHIPITTKNVGAFPTTF